MKFDNDKQEFIDKCLPHMDKFLKSNAPMGMKLKNKLKEMEEFYSESSLLFEPVSMISLAAEDTDKLESEEFLSGSIQGTSILYEYFKDDVEDDEWVFLLKVSESEWSRYEGIVIEVVQGDSVLIELTFNAFGDASGILFQPIDSSKGIPFFRHKY